MPETKPRPERLNKSRNEIREICFAQIAVSAKENLCHREAESLTEEKLENLAASLVEEGLATPLTVVQTDATVMVDGTSMPVFKLVGGHRRHLALKTAIESRLDPTRIHELMLVSVVVMVAGEDQTAEEFLQDVIVRSVTENEQRLKHTALERLTIVRQLEEAGVSIPRASSSLGISVTQYRRDRLVATWPWLFKAVEREEIGVSDAAQLAEIAKEKDCEEHFRKDFQAWVARKKSQLEEERAEQKKLGRELKGSANSIKKFIDGSLVKAWKASLQSGGHFNDETAEFAFGVVVDNDKKTVTVSGLSQPIDKLRSSDLATVISEMQTGVRKLVPLMRRLQRLEEATEISEADIEAELALIQREAREAAEAKAAREAGREPLEPLVEDSPDPQDLAVEIEEDLDSIDELEAEDQA